MRIYINLGILKARSEADKKNKIVIGLELTLVDLRRVVVLSRDLKVSRE